jgi:hypothetical protein
MGQGELWYPDGSPGMWAGRPITAGALTAGALTGSALASGALAGTCELTLPPTAADVGIAWSASTKPCASMQALYARFERIALPIAPPNCAPAV